MLNRRSNISRNYSLATFDFENLFPHKFWISDWHKNETFPDGFCYKLLSTRDERSGEVEIVLLRALRDGQKEELYRARVSEADADKAANVFVRGLEVRLGIGFEEQDYSGVRSLSEFQRLAEKHGWSLHGPSSTGSEE